MTPAHMNFNGGLFDYGDWEDVWFVKKNRPVMLRYDRTVDYELDHDDQTKKLGGGVSDISDINYEGNAMSEIPLGWVYRYEDETYEYEIVCEHQWDDNYKAYAHTRADGSIADCFYWSMFRGSIDNHDRLRSIAGTGANNNLNMLPLINACGANGDGWYLHTLSQYSYILTLLVLMGKSTDTQTVFGMGNSDSGTNTTYMNTGVLMRTGQFFGYKTARTQVKVFYIERFWGDQHDIELGCICKYGKIYYKMTPENGGYDISDITEYTDSGVVYSSNVSGPINSTICGEFGVFALSATGSTNTFECDWFACNVGIQAPLVRLGGHYMGPANTGGFAHDFATIVNDGGNGTTGGSLSAEQPLPKEEENYQ